MITSPMNRLVPLTPGAAPSCVFAIRMVSDAGTRRAVPDSGSVPRREELNAFATGDQVTVASDDEQRRLSTRYSSGVGAAASANGLPSESRQTAHRSPG